MRKNQTARRLLALTVVLYIAVGLISRADPAAPGSLEAPPAATSTGQAPAPAGQSEKPPPGAQLKPDHITQLFNTWGAINGQDEHGKAVPPGSVGLNQELRVVVAPAPMQLDAKQYVLFFNNREVKGLPGPYYDPIQHSLVFQLQRDKDNKDLWTALLGSPRHTTVPVTVSLGARSTDPNAAVLPTISATDGSESLNLDVLPPWRLAVALALIGAVIVLVWVRARRDPTLRDNLLPQIEPSQQTYSLGRWQMAFWFTLVLASFVLLFMLLWDTDTVTSQALTLMGISGATALAAVAVDVAKDSPADAVNRGLKALGLNDYDDVLRVGKEIAARQKELQSIPAPTPARITQLQTEIQDRNNILTTYQDKIRPFLTQGWFRDLTTDLNGTAIHRLQVFCWTWVLGGVFVFNVWQALAMPEFSATLLTLMGISSSGYVGFKIQETNN